MSASLVKLRFFPFLTLFLSALLLVQACSGAHARRPAVLDDKGPISGTELWTDAALHLPADAPLVGVIRLQQVLENTQELLNWTLAEPQMFGVHGDTFVQGMMATWYAIIGELGGNPLEAALWNQNGVDPARELLFGFYPSTTGDATVFTDTIENILKKRLQLEPDEDMLDAILAILHDDDREFWHGISAEVSRSVQKLRPQSGMRLVIPVFDDARLLDSLSKLAVASNYETVTANAGSDPNFDSGDHIFFNADSPWPIVRLRLEGNWATLDVVFKEFQLRTNAPYDYFEYRERMLADVIDISKKFPSGRPAAPRPPLDAALAVAFHQAGTAKMARVRGYGRALESLHPLNAADRDAFFIELIVQAMENVRTWELAGQNLPGTIYSATRNCPENTEEKSPCVLNLEMQLVGARSLPDIHTAKPPANPLTGLNLTERSVAAAIDLDPFFIKEWKQWVNVSMPAALLDGLEAITIDPVLAALSLPRGVALMLVNLEKLLLEDFQAANLQDYEHLIDPLIAVQRIELASIDLDMQRPNWYSRLAAMLFLRSDASTQQHDDVLEALRLIFTDLTIEMSTGTAAQRTQITEAMAAPLKKDTLSTFALPDQHALADLQYFYHSAAPTPFVFFSRGLSPEEATREIQRAQSPSPRRTLTAYSPETQAFYLRLEPIGLMSLLTESQQAHALEPVDLSILVQRLGPMLFTIHPDNSDGIRSLLYKFELHAPPEL